MKPGAPLTVPEARAILAVDRSTMLSSSVASTILPDERDHVAWRELVLSAGRAIAEHKARERERAADHEPVVARTLMDGPGNRSRIVACACHAPGVLDAATYAAHIGVPGSGPFIDATIELADAAQDALDYPSADQETRLRQAAIGLGHNRLPKVQQ